jgi:hypothetical protein
MTGHKKHSEKEVPMIIGKQEKLVKNTSGVKT